jgi:hypothetical protein
MRPRDGDRRTHGALAAGADACPHARGRAAGTLRAQARRSAPGPGPTADPGIATRRAPASTGERVNATTRGGDAPIRASHRSDFRPHVSYAGMATMRLLTATILCGHSNEVTFDRNFVFGHRNEATFDRNVPIQALQRCDFRTQLDMRA